MINTSAARLRVIERCARWVLARSIEVHRGCNVGCRVARLTGSLLRFPVSCNYPSTSFVIPESRAAKDARSLSAEPLTCRPDAARPSTSKAAENSRSTTSAASSSLSRISARTGARRSPTATSADTLSNVTCTAGASTSAPASVSPAPVKTSNHTRCRLKTGG